MGVGVVVHGVYTRLCLSVNYYGRWCCCPWGIYPPVSFRELLWALVLLSMGYIPACVFPWTTMGVGVVVHGVYTRLCHSVNYYGRWCCCPWGIYPPVSFRELLWALVLLSMGYIPACVFPWTTMGVGVVVHGVYTRLYLSVNYCGRWCCCAWGIYPPVSFRELLWALVLLSMGYIPACVFPWTTMGVGVVVHGVYTRLCLSVNYYGRWCCCPWGIYPPVSFRELLWALVLLSMGYIPACIFPWTTMGVGVVVHGVYTRLCLSVNYYGRWCCCAWGIYPPVSFRELLWALVLLSMGYIPACVFPWTTMGVGVVVHGVYTRLCLSVNYYGRWCCCPWGIYPPESFRELLWVLVLLSMGYIPACVFPWTTMGVGVVVHGVYSRLCLSVNYYGCWCWKLEKIWFFGVKSWFFTRNTPTMFAPPSARRNFFKCAPPPPPPNLKSWIRPWNTSIWMNAECYCNFQSIGKFIGKDTSR